MTAVRCVALMAVAVGRADDRHQPRTDAERGARTEAGGTGALGPAGITTAWPRVYLCHRAAAEGSSTARVRAGWRTCAGRSRRARASGMPMSASCTLAAQRATGQQHVARLEAEERHRRVACTTGPGARQWCRRDRSERRRRPPACPRRWRRATTVGRLAVERARQAGAEQRVDDEIGAGNPVRERLDGAVPTRRHLGRVAPRRACDRAEPRRTLAASLAIDAPRRSRRRHCCQDRRRRPWPAAAARGRAASATARPAFSISTPPVRRPRSRAGSARPISSVVSSSWPGKAPS